MSAIRLDPSPELASGAALTAARPEPPPELASGVARFILQPIRRRSGEDAK